MTPDESMGKLRPQAGFSLIELIVVISIAAVVMAVLTPGIRRSSDVFTLRRAASLTVVELRTAQSLATNNGTDIMFEFYTSTGLGGPGGVRYWVQPVGTSSWFEVRKVLPPEWPGIIQMRHSLGLADCVAPADVTHKCLKFKPLGYVEDSGTIKVRVRSGGTVEWDIIVDAATGRVRIDQ